MIYWENTELQIRSMIKEDIPSFTEAFLEMGWTPKPEIHERYLKEQAEGKRYIFVAQYKGQTAGYATLLPLACDGPYKECYPEVVDFNVWEKFRRHGIGNRILDAAENFAASFSDHICLSVGLYSGYGSAQRMYVKRGYIPDGSGIWWNQKPLPPYADCCNDDDLVLFLAKELRRA